MLMRNMKENIVLDISQQERWSATNSSETGHLSVLSERFLRSAQRTNHQAW